MPASTPPALPPPTARRHRPGAALGLVALVLWLHGGLMFALAPALPARWGAASESPARATAVQVRAVAQVAAAEPVAEPAAEPVSSVDLAHAPHAAKRAATPPAAAHALAVPAANPTVAAAADVAPAAPAAIDGSAEPADRSGGGAQAPPVYATRIPPPVSLRYALRYNGRTGDATLSWRHDGVRYQLALDGQGAGEALVVQASQGSFDNAGLAPERFTDRRRGSRLQAANFRRDIGRIGFSGPAVDYPAWPGAQDRLSWLPQFVAIRAAAAVEQAGEAGKVGEGARSATSLFVVDARGAAALWHFQFEGDALLATPLGPVTTQRWRREPPRPEGLRVEAWLDAARGHWPVQLRFTALRSGDVFELLLLAEPLAAP